MQMIHAMLDDNIDMNPDNSIIVKTKLNIASHEKYSGSSNLEVYEMFVAGMLCWLKMNGLLSTKHAAFQVEYLGTRLKSNAFEWYKINVERHDRPIKIWFLESIFKGLQKCFLNTLTHRQVSNKFNTIKQGKCTFQELTHDLTKYAGCMVQYSDNYLFKRQLLSPLRPWLQKEVLHREITAEFSSIQEILEKSKDIETSS